MSDLANMKISYIFGDISKTPSDALITAINSGGAWFGGIDGVIQRVAGDLFHKQAISHMPLKDGQTIVARGIGMTNFKNVVFVVDDLKKKLREIIFNGLQTASDAGFSSVTLPAIRTGVMLGAVERSIEEAVTEMAQGVKDFVEKNPNTNLNNITFVIYSEQRTMELMKKILIT